MTGYRDIPFLGSGIAFRKEIAAGIYQQAGRFDFIEVLADHFMYDAAALAYLDELKDTFTVVPHGVGLSIGSCGEDDRYIDAAERVSEVSNAPYYSDHLCVTRVPGIEFGHLSPLWFCRATLASTADRVNRVQDRLQKTLVLENITYDFAIPHGNLSQGEFFTELVTRTGCGLLLDVTNLYTNSVNHGFDPLAVADRLPLDSVIQVHLAGGVWDNGILLDGHCAPVPEEVWDLFARIAGRTPIRAALLEHDRDFPEFGLLASQVDRARQILTGEPAIASPEQGNSSSQPGTPAAPAISAQVNDHEPDTKAVKAPSRTPLNTEPGSPIQPNPLQPEE
jgi:uncharacterized protein